MKSNTFRDSSGETTKNVTAAELKNLIFNGGDEFWAGGSGESMIRYFENGEIKARLLISALEDYGFMLHHNFSHEERELVLADGAHTGETIEIAICGDPFPCFREYFVMKEIAWEAIEYFLQTGERLEKFRWQIHETPESEI